MVRETLWLFDGQPLQEGQHLCHLLGVCMSEVGEVERCVRDYDLGEDLPDFLVLMGGECFFDDSDDCAKSIKVDEGGRMLAQGSEELLQILKVLSALLVEEGLEMLERRRMRVVEFE